MNINLSLNQNNYNLSFAAQRRNRADIEKDIAQFVSEGKTDKEIAEKLQYSYEYVGNVRRRMNVKPSSTAIPRSQIEPLACSGKTNKECADILGISYQWFKDLKRRYGLTRDYPELDVEKVESMVLEGKSDKEISESFGGGRLRRIAEIRKSMGKEYKYSAIKTPPEILEKIKRLDSEGKSLEEIAQAINKSVQWTRVLCNNLHCGKKDKLLQFQKQLEVLFAEGKSVQECAEILKKDIRSIYYYKNKFRL